MHFIGIEAFRYDTSATQFGRFSNVLETFGIDLILGVGANEGQFGESLRASGYKGDIVSFEPLKLAHHNLLKISKRDPHWHVHPISAVGDRIGEVEVNVSENSVSSSILPMLSSHKQAAPKASYIGKETCDLITLDSVRSIYQVDAKSVLLKIDTQGYEWQVLDGANETISMARGVLIEMSLIPLYEGQKLWQDITHRLESEGFTLWALQPAFINPANGRTLQLDGLFFRL
ncbi:Methyltransferase FkbM family [Candidatus Methylopumilus turicensis]|uniref:Methyltransferase FkbM family n=2 Tax=Candidatus Methylopumilus turicensis TaxID=1581680 RepID=A0A0B7IUQ1_9PROT|nr:Methyltransferase FkbM family [Candidatus Methylopumilus turicensis]